jgi:D-lactate dehydrogenase
MKAAIIKTAIINPITLAVFSTKSYDKSSLSSSVTDNIAITFFENRLTSLTAKLAAGFDAICVFVNDELDRDVLTQLASFGVKYILLRCAGFNNLDLAACKELGLRCARVPSYGPEAVAEHTVALMMTLNRHIHKAYNRTKEDNFSLSGLMGFNIHGKTVGIIGTGNIGRATAKIMKGFGAHVIAYDPVQNNEIEQEIGFTYTDLNTLLTSSDIISLHCPLNDATYHLLNEASIANMKTGVMIINTSRGGLVDTNSLIKNLKSGQIGHLALDVYEQESELFFEDRSGSIIQDDVFQRLLTFPNVIITGHQGFFTAEALEQIATTTIENLTLFITNKNNKNELF